ncbi:tRNA-dihydrouridine synthase 4-like protein [Tieghemostelium lacteum]|uniref:tRNA-dihydrouridine synthase n=1 Tax=Tieghemostelium lacteum TaxID=361077 RepID=A0A151ZEF9_TIELA|nr:tRNA-dihydrouridine synthase 4-like protein [Tieghemostelium lacteum]|eukprot:KYQ92346.1 tRNA-dihydrouridine synthase 4-like protein [Tieghemostelium lacteum]
MTPLDDIVDQNGEYTSNDTLVKLYNLRDQRPKQTLMERIHSGEFMKIQAPMVRFSRLPFRLLCSLWGCDITYTPMIMAYEFNRSSSCRDSDFTTNQYDQPMVVQFGAKSAEELVSAAEKVAKHCQGVDLNCGCPQGWVMREGYGAKLLSNPELIMDMTKQLNNRIGNLPCSIKIRIQPDLQKTVELVKRAEHCGISWITVHGRTHNQRSSHPVNYNAIKLVKESTTLPVFANGDVFTLQQANEIRERTGVNGVMAARGLLMNPAMYSGNDQPPLEVIKDFINLYAQFGSLSPVIFHRHLMYMLYNYLNRNEKSEFNQLQTVVSIVDYLNDKFLF